jgi:hypothetical protein
LAAKQFNAGKSRKISRKAVKNIDVNLFLMCSVISKIFELEIRTITLHLKMQDTV